MNYFKNMNAKAADYFDQQLNLFIWPKVETMDIERLHNVKNYTPENCDEAVGSYLKWLSEIFPQLDPEDKDEQHVTLAQLVLNILFEHDPEHHIHFALKQ